MYQELKPDSAVSTSAEPAAGRKFAEFRFYEELNEFLAPELRKTEFPVAIDRKRSVKDAIESVGVPHTEVDLVLVDGASVSFNFLLQGGERVSVYPVFERLDIAPLVHLRPAPLREIRFVLDAHLGKLARYLRLAGFDSLWSNDFADEEIVAHSVAQHRIILTRDKGILRRRVVTHGHFVRETDPDRQLSEVIRVFQLERLIRPFTRCLVCNGDLREIARHSALGRVPEKVWAEADSFTECAQCRQLFWRGTHFERLQRILAAAG